MISCPFGILIYSVIKVVKKLQKMTLEIAKKCDRGPSPFVAMSLSLNNSDGRGLFRHHQELESIALADELCYELLHLLCSEARHCLFER